VFYTTNGVSLREVNPAYTSQVCPERSYVHKDNRNGDRFKCRDCGMVGDANLLAAKTVLSRLEEKEITLYTPYKKVKEILMRRYLEKKASAQTSGRSNSLDHYG